jgi:hypothetical protein
MANFKRKRPKNRRAGCLFCKPWKVNGTSSKDRLRWSELKNKTRDGVGEKYGKDVL